MSPGGRPYLSVGSEAEGAAGDDLQISFTTQVVKILFTAEALGAFQLASILGACLSVQRPTPCLPACNTCSHITLGPDLERRCACLAAQNMGGGIVGVSLASHVRQYFAVRRANAKTAGR